MCVSSSPAPCCFCLLVEWEKWISKRENERITNGKKLDLEGGGEKNMVIR